MNTDEYEKMFRLEEYSWWFRGRQAIVESLLRRHTPFARERLDILDVGCGTGKILRDFEALGHRLVGLDFSPVALAYSAGRGAENLIRGDASCLPIADATFDLITAFDIMEHVEDDRAMAEEMMRVLRPGGQAILTVPAHPSLWSEHDIALHHYRRYTRASFREVLTGAGFRLERYTYAITSVFPIALLYRLQSKLRERGGANGREAHSHMFRLPSPINGILSGILRGEAALVRRVNMPIGLSLIAVLSK